MFRNSFQGGLLTVFYAGGSNPLKIWEIKKESGYLQCFLDQDIKAMVVEIGATNVSTTYIRCPMGKDVFGITLPFLVMIVKNLKKYFTFEVTILDDTNVRRRFRVANFQSTTKVLPLCTAMPICLADGWNQIQFNLADFTQRAYGRQYMETLTLKINANIRIRRIYFTDKLIPEEELPAEYKLYFPIAGKKGSRSRAPSKAETEIKAEEPPVPSRQPSAMPPESSLQQVPESTQPKDDLAECTCIEDQPPRPECICAEEDDQKRTPSKSSIRLSQINQSARSVRPSRASVVSKGASKATVGGGSSAVVASTEDATAEDATAEDAAAEEAPARASIVSKGPSKATVRGRSSAAVASAEDATSEGAPAEVSTDDAPVEPQGEDDEVAENAPVAEDNEPDEPEPAEDDVDKPDEDAD